MFNNKTILEILIKRLSKSKYITKIIVACSKDKNDEEIKTDELIWDKKKRTVTSDKPVRVRIRNEKIIKAEGFESDETFMSYKLKKVTGIVYLDEEIEPQQPQLIE